MSAAPSGAWILEDTSRWNACSSRSSALLVDVSEPLVGQVCHMVLGMETVRGVELHLEPLPLRG